MFENPEALARLAALMPVAEGAKLDVMLSKLGHAPGAADVAKL